VNRYLKPFAKALQRAVKVAPGGIEPPSDSARKNGGLQQFQARVDFVGGLEARVERGWLVFENHGDAYAWGLPPAEAIPRLELLLASLKLAQEAA
jgi:hypothetical protein